VTTISAVDVLAHRDVAVHGSTLHYIEGGAGPPVVFLHGNPTSSHLWRGVLRRLPFSRRLIAVDLIGMGASGKPDIEYSLPDHLAYVEAFLDALGLDGIVFVAHDWGVPICLDLLRRQPDRVRGVAVMEGHLWPLRGWGEFDAGARETFRQLREPGTGERLVLEENVLVDTVLPRTLRRRLSPADLAIYRRPYPDAPSRRPLLKWIREIPIGGHPEHSTAILDQAWAHLRSSPVPKLLVHAQPGAVVTAGTVSRCRSTLRNLSVCDIGAGGHFLPEDRPAEVADAVSRWISALPHRGG
jgi:haloalkane dehalogenase